MANKKAIPPKHSQFKPGESGNPAGRPKQLPELEVILASVLGKERPDGTTEAEAILEALRKKAMSGDVRASELLLDRAYGKAKQTMQINGNLSTDNKHEIVFKDYDGDNKP